MPFHVLQLYTTLVVINDISKTLTEPSDIANALNNYLSKFNTNSSKLTSKKYFECHLPTKNVIEVKNIN